MVQRSFLRKIDGMNGLDYWKQLQALKINSLERRWERYQIIYVWKILEGLVPNLSGSSKIEPRMSDRRGRSCYRQALDRNSYQQLRNNSLSIHGVKLFNCIPKKIRNLTNCPKEKFKSELDMFLKLIPDEPQIPGYTSIRRADTNSIVDMIKVSKERGAACSISQFQAASSTTATRWRSEDFGHDNWSLKLTKVTKVSIKLIDLFTK